MGHRENLTNGVLNLNGRKVEVEDVIYLHLHNKRIYYALTKLNRQGQPTKSSVSYINLEKQLASLWATIAMLKLRGYDEFSLHGNNLLVNDSVTTLKRKGVIVYHHFNRDDFKIVLSGVKAKL